jgi:dihydroxyacetone kinase-like protein
VPGKVGIVTGGGSGHLPLFLGYVGQGMLDGCAIGDVFQSPRRSRFSPLPQAVDSGAGVLYLYGNYNGDISILIWRRKWPTWRVISEPRR